MPINGEIRSDKIRLISESGEQLGIVSLNEALAKAEEASLDLVQMAKDGDPLVCRLLNHGKHVFDAKKQKAASKKKEKRQQIKEIKLRNLNLLGSKKDFDKIINVKVRSTGRLLRAKINILQTSANVEILDKETGISPGQACVFYSKDDIGDKVLGGGWIHRTFNKNLSTKLTT